MVLYVPCLGKQAQLVDVILLLFLSGQLMTVCLCVAGGGSKGGAWGWKWRKSVRPCVSGQRHLPPSLVSNPHHPHPLHRRGILCVNCGPGRAANFQEPQQQNTAECFLVFYTVISGQKKSSSPVFPCRFPKRPSLCLWHQDVFA